MSGAIALNSGNVEDFIKKNKGSKVKSYDDVSRFSEDPQDKGGFDGIPDEDPEKEKSGFDGIPDDEPRTESSESSEGSQQDDDFKDPFSGNSTNAEFLVHLMDMGGQMWLSFVAKSSPEIWALQHTQVERLRMYMEQTLDEMDFEVHIPAWAKLAIVAAAIYWPMYREARKMGDKNKKKSKSSSANTASKEKPQEAKAEPGESQKNTDDGPVEYYEINGDEAVQKEPPSKDTHDENGDEYPELTTEGDPHPSSWIAKGKKNPLTAKEIKKRLKKSTPKCDVCKTNPIKPSSKGACSQSCNGIRQKKHLKNLKPEE